MLLCAYQKTTLLDYPGHVAATVFTGGCNFRCPFCHNSPLALDPVNEANCSTEEFLHFLEKRKSILTGVCVTGGEPTLQADLPDFLRDIKDLGYLVKLDTNGYLPVVLEHLLEKKLIDYVAMDIKASPEKYALVTGVPGLDFSRIQASIELLKEASIPHEFRTTVVREYHEKADFLEIAKLLSPESLYFLQSFRDSENVMQKDLHSHSKETLEEILALVRPMLPKAALRGID